MNKASSSESKNNDGFEEDDIFEDSSLLANFDHSFKQTSKISESNMNESRNDLNVSALCCDEEINGYDKLTGKTWIYPTNYPVRDYQFNIIKAALLKNTLVSLPTGLGKTFIAAVIMYNFYRWYPLGKIVFTAPTRPLVAQQIEACYNIIAIPPNDTIEMTGHMQVKTRKDYWHSKRVFFATPQVIYNDMKSGICPCSKIKCLVIDEAHKARGNYAYCQIVSTLDEMGHKIYRLLALSATPGSKVDDVINVVKNLHIAHLELRTENCIDVAPYSHARKINTVVIKLSQQLNTLRQQYVEILDGYARRLKQLNILPQNIGNLSKGRIVMLYKELQSRDRAARHPQHNHIMKDFTLLIALYHGLELLVQHGCRVFLNFFDEHPEKSWIQTDDRLTALLERLRDDLGINPLSLDRSMLPDGSVPEIPANICFGHPKFDKLKKIMMSHFTKAESNKQDTRAIVFCEYRESVNLVHCLLLQCRPLIKPQMFVGQGASGKDGKTMVSQKQQLRVMRSFREGACNTLVATCVAEEGLDVGSVDLILCFDISTKSPIRLVQRCGRTGRERGGQVYILVTEGREHQTLLDCMRQRDGLNRLISQSKEVENNLYKSNPRMMPRDFTPQCQKMFITVEKKTDPKEKSKEGVDKAKKGQKDLRSMLLGRPSTSGASSINKGTDSSDVITEKEFKELFPDGYSDTNLLPTPKEYWVKNKDSFKHIEEPDESMLKLTRWLEWQRTLQKTVNVTHSKDSEILSELLQYADAKRFEMPVSTQNPGFATQQSPTKLVLTSQKLTLSSPAKAKQIKKTKKAPLFKSPSKKDGDIRALFSTATKSTKSYTKLINDLGIRDDGGIPTRLISLLVDLSLENTNSAKKCYICQNICECSALLKLRTQKKARTIFSSLQELRLPDVDLIDDFDSDTVVKCVKKEDSDINMIDDSDHNNTEEHIKGLNVSKQSIGVPYMDSSLECVKKSEEIEESVVDGKLNLSNNFDLELDFLVANDSKSVIEDEHQKLNESVNSDPFDVGNIEDIFADSSPEEAIAKETELIEEPKEAKEVLNFFGLDSIEDIFADDEIEDTPPEITKMNNKNSNSKNTNTLISPDKVPLVEYPLSPSILSGRVKPKEIPTSPILGSQSRKYQLSTKKGRTNSSTPIGSCRKQLMEDPTNNNVIDNKKVESLIKNSINETNSKSMLTLTQLEAIINKTDNDISVLKKSNLSDAVHIKDDNRSTSPILLAECDRNSSPILSNQSKQSLSPILLTQTERKRSLLDKNNSDKLTQSTYQMKRQESLIILDSDSDSDTTQVYDAVEEIAKHSTDYSISVPSQLPEVVGHTSGKTYGPNNFKRKLDMDSSESIIESPHFSKKQKVGDKPLNGQDKSSTILTLKKINKHYRNDNTILNCAVSQTKCLSQKENRNPQHLDIDTQERNINKYNISMLQMFRRDNKIDKNDISAILKTSPTKCETSQKRKLAFDDSEDEFVTDENHSYRSPHTMKSDKYNSTTNHKVRKKIKKNNSFLDMEAVLSDDNGGSDDELTDDSVGSIVDFICDDSVIPQEDIQAVYLKSIKSPVKAGAFKIPELPKKYNREEILSQVVDEDAYEMDSFCVDSNVGLTQANEEMSELEVAEMMLEEKRRSKKKLRRMCTQDDSPEVKAKSKPNRRQIRSDSEDSE